MNEERRENVFTPKDRQLLKDTHGQLQGINGSVRRHDEEIFGCENHNTPGLIQEVSELQALALQAKTAVRVVVALIALVGITNILILLRGG